MNFSFSADETALQRALDDIEQRIRDAAVGAVKDAASLAVEEGNANIAAAGFKGKVPKVQSRFYPDGPAVVVFDAMPFASVFERGASA